MSTLASSSADIDIEKLQHLAKVAWFKTRAVLEILRNFEQFPIQHKTPQRPPSGSWFLFNRRVHHFFRNDGYQWHKRTNGKSSNEAHEYLKVDNVKALNCYYARGEENPTFMRRIYWMLEPAYDHIVLVHYRDVLEGTLTAPQHFAIMLGDHETDMQVPNIDCCSETNVQQFAVMHGDHETDMQIEPTPDHMPLQHLKDITNNFCNERILGRGGFGVVYKGVLQNGKMVAVKKLVQSMSSSQEQFENEVNLLMKLKHTNIVQLLGYCYETQHLRKLHEGKFIFAWNTECLLCLECLPKGSLDKYISDASYGFDWPTRLQIIEGISYGLQYLHEQSDGPIIHLDLKPANILLDENMIPKITDFGLSRLFDKKQTIHTAVTTGKLGYMPPEYLRGIITPMSDIFSLGVIIMEVITGHRDYPYDIRTSSKEFIELELKKWRDVLQIEPGYTSLEIDCQQITRCIQIGLICVNPERTKRPAMKKVIDMLQGLESMDWYISNELSSRPQHPGGAAVN
ncbi:putative receptor-like protein kinase At4g00960 isoform X2 [Triticum dicoccoides]|uniref:putative receptor-like protein kinase At4g00960 isoform X2 n=1 Tax=Triticum dicoccoides TaxID=85692 RepID=UPI000E7BD98D|nr:putative receptor-like protein kinase At4g00960 isoform X2 [Triticum dicoccoides]XP_037444562.1 putative receptor-like protein kinase At4g00960 isoform X2 [Triticum dicoccoides]XP_037444563.1 putative receptor-like protein kinase At4g00960 isoform X2 [Triticum dicoccoides]